MILSIDQGTTGTTLLLVNEEGKIVRKTIKGKIDSSDIKKLMNLTNEP